MKRIVIILLPLVMLGASQTAGAQNSIIKLFENPPEEYRPFVRWWWNGDKVDTNELKRELRVLREAGIGGVEINPIEFPSKRCDSLGIRSLTWLSDEWLEALEATLREAERLGMRCDLLVGSGWPFGKEDLSMEQRAQVMLTLAHPYRLVGGDTLTVERIFEMADPKVTTPNPDRRFHLEALYLAPDSMLSLKDAVALPLPKEGRIDYSVEGAPDSGYLYALVRVESFASVINGAPGASGPILDHMDAVAVRQYLDYMRQRLESRLGPMRRWLRAYFVDSMELEGSNWTDDFAAEFRKRCGYDLMPYLPFIMFKTGRLGEVESYRYGAAKSPEFDSALCRVRLDFETTKAQLLHERYTETFLAWCHEQGVMARAQAYGRGFFPLESSKGYDIPEGESWTTNYLRHRVGEEMPDDDYRRGRAYTMINKYVSSAAHQMGRRIVSAEEMTNTYRLFETNLELLKAGSNMSVFSGVTHSVWHGFNYSPPEAGFPGWVQYGSYLNEQNTWWPYFKLLNDYRARISAVLQNADMQADIAIVLPTKELWAKYGVQTEPFPNYPKGSKFVVPQLLWEAIHKNGGNCDFVNSPDPRYKVLVEIGDSTITFVRDGERYRFPMPSDNNYLEWYGNVQDSLNLPHAVSISYPDRYLLQNHYRSDAGEDIFFFANASIDKTILSRINLPQETIKGKAVWFLDPDYGQKKPVILDHNGRFFLNLRPTDAGLILITREGRKEYRRAVRRLKRTPLRDLEARIMLTQFETRFQQPITGMDTTLVMEMDKDLRETDFKDFSGTITMRATFRLDSLGDCYIISIPTKDVCEFSINGSAIPPFYSSQRLIIMPKDFFRLGDNAIEIRLTTTLNNYVHTLVDDPVVQHYVIKRKVPTTPAGLTGPVIIYF